MRSHKQQGRDTQGQFLTPTVNNNNKKKRQKMATGAKVLNMSQKAESESQ